MTELRIGRITIRWLYDNDFQLDGGAMFGVVPRLLWSRRYPSDDENFIPLCSRPLLVTTPDARVLIETGLGDKLTDKQRRNFRVRGERGLGASLADAGLSPDDIDIVILTHLDFDHASGNTLTGPDGRLTPAFPRARHIVQRRELEDALAPNIRTINTYWADNLQPLLDRGLFETVDGDVEVVPGIRLALTGGHTRGHQVVLIESEGETALHMADLQPTHAHANPLWVMAYDNYPLDSIHQKKAWLDRARAEGWWITFYHDPFVLAGRWNPAGELVERIDGHRAHELAG